MKYDPDIHHRRSIRLRGYDYSVAGVYFVTVCTQERECLFGEIVAGEMQMNDAGQIVESVWNDLPVRYPGVAVDVYVVMPNHFHGIVVLINEPVGAPLAAPSNQRDGEMDQGAASGAPTLGTVIRAFKSISAIAVNRITERSGRLWQRNYYERVIRNEQEWQQAGQYIIDNPQKWDLDRENPANHHP